MDPDLWELVDREASRRGISVSALMSTIVADRLRPNEQAVVDVFRNLSQVATLGLAPWKERPKPSS